MPGCTPGDHRPHVREDLAPPPGAASAHHWLRLAETRMSTGMRGARGGALCSGRGACALPAFQREVGRGRRAGARSGLRWRGVPGRPEDALVPVKSQRGVPAGSEGRMEWEEESWRSHVDFDPKSCASIKLCAENPTLVCGELVPQHSGPLRAVPLDLLWGTVVIGRANAKHS